MQGTLSYFELQRWGVGTVLRPGAHPEGKELPKGIEDAILLNPDIPRIDADNWSAVQNLFIHCIEEDLGDSRKNPFTWSRSGRYAHPSNEVAVIFCLAEDYSHWIVITARQVVSHASVQEDRTRGGINILTGEKYATIPPPGYMEFGTCHSHNTMAFPRFSGTDDANELNINGWHILCSTYRKQDGRWRYVITPSVVAGGKRYESFIDPDSWEIKPMLPEDLIDTEFKESVTLHPDALQYVTVEKPKDWSKEWGGSRPPKDGKFLPVVRKDDDDGLWGRSHYGFDIDFDEFFKHIDSQTDLPGQTLMFDLGDDDERVNVESDYARVKRLMEMETEAILDCVQHMEMLVDNRRIVAELLARALNKTGLLRKVKALKNP